VPIGCILTKICHIQLTAYTNASAGYAKCIGVVLEKSTCGIAIDSNTYNNELHIPITTQETGTYQTKEDVYFVHLMTGETNENKLWPNYQLPPIKVCTSFMY